MNPARQTRLWNDDPVATAALYEGYALSLKQPWAALLAHGRKTIEIRRWPTARRGIVLIHAARIPDERPEAWAQVPPELADAARLCGGIIGVADLTSCIPYR